MKTRKWLFLVVLLSGCTNNCSSQTEYIARTNDFQSNIIPVEVFKMETLKVLDITGMDCDFREYDEKGNNVTKCWGIEKIPPEIGNLKNLQRLSLYLNGIEKIPREIEELEELKFINLAENRALTNIDNLVGIENLDTLILDNCNLRWLPKDIGKMQRLRVLSVINNRIPVAEQQRVKKALPNCKIDFKDQFLE